MLAAWITAAGFILSFVMALLLLCREGNPALLLFWSVAAVGALRMGRSWLDAIRQLRPKNPPAAVQSDRAMRRGDAIDVLFSDLPAHRAPLLN